MGENDGMSNAVVFLLGGPTERFTPAGRSRIECNVVIGLNREFVDDD
jgi:hypothetical protein